MLVSLLMLHNGSGDSSLYYYPAYRKCDSNSGLWRFQRPEDRCDKMVAPDPEKVDWTAKAVIENTDRLLKEALDKRFKRLMDRMKDDL